MNLSPELRKRYFDQNGVPLAGGQLFTYVAGTTTPQATYSNQTGTANANPVVLDSQGYADVWLDPALSYKFVLKDSLNNVQWTVDQVIPTASGLQAWISTTTYSQGNIVQDSSGAGLLYVSLTNSNTGNALSNPSFWRLFAGNVRTISSNTTLSVTDNMVRSNSTAGSLTHTLPPCASSPIGLLITVKDVGTGGNATSVKGSGGDLVDGNNVWSNTISSMLCQSFRNNGASWDTAANPPISTSNIASGAITQPLLAARSTGATVGVGGVAISASSGNFSTSSASPVAVTNLSVTITTTGRPVRVFLQSDGSVGNVTRVACGNSSTAPVSGFFYLYRGASIVSSETLEVGAGNPAAGQGITVPAGSIQFLDTPAAGTYTYSLQVAPFSANGSPSMNVGFVVLVAYEI
jgi:hypothetical protein